MAFQELTAMIMSVFPQYDHERVLNLPIETFLNLMDMAAFEKYGRPIPERKKKKPRGKFLTIEEFEKTHKYDSNKGWIQWQ